MKARYWHCPTEGEESLLEEVPAKQNFYELFPECSDDENMPFPKSTQKILVSYDSKGNPDAVVLFGNHLLKSEIIRTHYSIENSEDLVPRFDTFLAEIENESQVQNIVKFLSKN